MRVKRKIDNSSIKFSTSVSPLLHHSERRKNNTGSIDELL
jgi:hypothetical protein